MANPDPDFSDPEGTVPAYLNISCKDGAVSERTATEHPCKDGAVSERQQLSIDALIKAQNGNGYRSVLPERPIPKGNSGIFFYEVTYTPNSGTFRNYGIYIGLATKQRPLGKWVGFYNGTYAYDAWGKFWAHANAIDEKHVTFLNFGTLTTTVDRHTKNVVLSHTHTSQKCLPMGPRAHMNTML
uniref:Uncharacterized protein n=1 Tax=Globodera rostochiensis TaxID=31243 RepID=A0A914H584_GLORO